jgi:hypothetical protein
MSLSGKLEELPLPHLLQIISNNRVTGKLGLTRRDGHGLVVFRDGKIIYAATNSARETFGNILLLRKEISASVLEEALERQQRSAVERRLGSILLEMGAIREEVLHRVMFEQVEKVLHELFDWKSGFVKFEVLDIPERGEVAVDAADFLVDEGLPTERLVVEVMRRLQEDRGDHLDRELLAVLGDGGDPPAKEAAAIPADVVEVDPDRLPTLKSLMTEIRSPAFTGEVTLGILRFAGHLMRRGVLFLHASGLVTGMGQFGIEVTGESADARVRKIRVPAEEPSVFLDVIERQETYRGPLERRFWNVELTRALGGGFPTEVVAVPMVVGGRVALIFYGDDLPDGGPLPQVDDLELLMIQGGLAIEKAALELRLHALENRQRGGGAAAGA